MAKRKKPEPMNFHVRWMIRKDMPEVLDANNGAHEPVEEEDYLRWLRARSRIGMVCEIDNRGGKNHELVVGHMIYELNKNSLEIIRFVVHKKWRGRGAGRVMLEKLFSKLSSHRRTQIFADVPDECLEVQLFLKRHGFRCTSVLKDEAAYRMVYDFASDGDDETELDARPGLGVNRIAAFADDAEHGGES